MSGSMSAYPPPAPPRGARAAGGGTGTVRGAEPPTAARSPAPSRAPVPVPPPRPDGKSLAAGWPLRDFLELGALPTAVPCARLHARLLVREWGLATMVGNVEILVSELVTNAVHASRALGPVFPVRLWLLADAARVLIIVWDASPQLPVRAEISTEAESGRGLLLVEMLSDEWGTWAVPAGGKTVWALTGTP
jgi:anti-sigma regulatory factor (Ser/Thr protein kinase)